MNFYLHFISVNSKFDQNLADDFFDGQETEDNIKYLWEDELKVAEPVKEFKIVNNSTYTLAGYYPNNSQFSFEIPDMTICNCVGESGNRMQFAVSKKILKKTDKKVDEESGETHLYFYFSDVHPMINPMNGVYIFKGDFPKELVKPVEN